MSVLDYRKYVRVEVEIPVDLWGSGDRKPSPGMLSNVSEEGASLLAPQPIAVATTLEFDISLGPQEPPAHVRGDVLWSRPVNENGQKMFAHGVLFNRIAIEDRERLHGFIARSMSY